MSYCDISAMYTQNMYTPYLQTFQTQAYTTPTFESYPSIFGSFPKIPIQSVFDSTIFGYTPPTGFSYLGQGGINPPYNVYPYSIDTLYSGNTYNSYNLGYNSNPFSSYVPAFNTNWSSGSYVNPFSTGGLGGDDFFSSSFGAFGSILTNGFQSSTAHNQIGGNGNTSYTGKNNVVNRALQLAYRELQLGVKEDIRNNKGTNDSKEIRKYKHGAVNSNEWCGYFVSWLYEQGQNRNNNNTFGYQANSQAMRRKAESKGFYAKKNSGYTPKPGDIMVLKKNEYKGHVGIVTKVFADGSFETIEGNQSNKVTKVHSKMSRKNLDGFIRMEDWLNSV